MQFKSEGSGGMPEFKSQLETEGDSILWGGFKVLAVDDRGNTISRRAKFIFVKYLPSAAKSITKARAGPHKGPLKMFINAHLDVEVSCLMMLSCLLRRRLITFFQMQIESVDQLTEEDLKTKLLAVGGAHAPNSYEFHDYSG